MFSSICRSRIYTNVLLPNIVINSKQLDTKVVIRIPKSQKAYHFMARRKRDTQSPSEQYMEN
jgi:hypothetical protein